MQCICHMHGNGRNKPLFWCKLWYPAPGHQGWKATVLFMTALWLAFHSQPFAMEYTLGDGKIHEHIPCICTIPCRFVGDGKRLALPIARFDRQEQKNFKRLKNCSQFDTHLAVWVFLRSLYDLKMIELTITQTGKHQAIIHMRTWTIFPANRCLDTFPWVLPSSEGQLAKHGHQTLENWNDVGCGHLLYVHIWYPVWWHGWNCRFSCIFLRACHVSGWGGGADNVPRHLHSRDAKSQVNLHHGSYVTNLARDVLRYIRGVRVPLIFTCTWGLTSRMCRARDALVTPWGL